ncbi:unnamed protein product, partial [Rotaria sordida]
PKIVILNSISTTKFICIKEKDDYQNSNVNLSFNIYSEYIPISTNRLNNTAIETIMQSFHYIDAFHLIYSSKGKIGIGTRSDTIIGSKK